MHITFEDIMRFLSGSGDPARDEHVRAALGTQNSEASKYLQELRHRLEQAFGKDLLVFQGAAERVPPQRFWEHYLERVTGMARVALDALPENVGDKGRAALVFDSFWHQSKRGRFPDIADPHDLWKTLLAGGAREDEHRALPYARKLPKPDERSKPELPEANETTAQDVAGETLADNGWSSAFDPDPEFGRRIALACARLLALLEDDTLRRVSIWKLAGLTQREIAQRLDVSVPVVEEHLDDILTQWKEADLSVVKETENVPRPSIGTAASATEGSNGIV